jgi:hypothetical protein
MQGKFSGAAQPCPLVSPRRPSPFVVDAICVLHFDNEAGKGDHKHIGKRQVPYEFSNLGQLLNDFWNDIRGWRRS